MGRKVIEGQYPFRIPVFWKYTEALVEDYLKLASTLVTTIRPKQVSSSFLATEGGQLHVCYSIFDSPRTELPVE